ncbi:MAG: hypothetical protein ACUZ8I_02010 [Candidatus Scalindua sp.]
MNELQILPVQEIKAQVNAIQELMRDVMVEDTHYGVIPGCGDKPSLLKAGAEKLAMAFRLDIQTETDIIDLDGGHREYRCTTSVYSIASGTRLGNGAGCATTMETKWRYRTENTGAEVPKEYWESRNSELLGGSQFSTRKVDGKWFIFHKVEHDNPADYYNTCQKMAEKRSKVCAVLNVTAASDIFTQDIEDMTSGTVSNGKTQKQKTAVKKTQSKSSQKEEVEEKEGKAYIKVETVSEQDGTKKGKPWTKYSINSVGGTTYNTFDHTMGQDAKDIAGTDVEALVLFKPGKYGNTIQDNGFNVQGPSEDDSVNPEEEREPGQEG